MTTDSPLDVIRDELCTLGQAVRTIAETQATHTRMLAALLDAAADPLDSDTELVSLLERILVAVEAQTVALDGVRQAVLGSQRQAVSSTGSRE